MKILIVAVDETRWGPARLPKFLQQAGFRVAALCPADNPLAATKYLDQRFELPKSSSAIRLGGALRSAMKMWQPQLVIPADEMIVALFHALLEGEKRMARRLWSTEALDRLAASLCPAEQRGAMLFKNECQELAQKLGVPAPAGARARTPDEAAAIANQLGYPVVLKQSFGWGGMGVRLCGNAAELEAGFAQMTMKPHHPLAMFIKHMLGRDWFPPPQDLWVQQAIAGDPAMYSFVATAGRMHAGFGGTPRATSTRTGPSTVVDFGPHPQMADSAQRMARAMGASGFVSFDFMIERATGIAYLLECNARPNQVSHLGARVGVDLCKALYEGMRSGARANERATGAAQRSETIALFPQEWLRAPDSPALRTFHHDVPWDDATLLERCLSAAPPAHPSFLSSAAPELQRAGKASAAA